MSHLCERREKRCACVRCWNEPSIISCCGLWWLFCPIFPIFTSLLFVNLVFWMPSNVVSNDWGGMSSCVAFILNKTWWFDEAFACWFFIPKTPFFLFFHHLLLVFCSWQARLCLCVLCMLPVSVVSQEWWCVHETFSLRMKIKHLSKQGSIVFHHHELKSNPTECSQIVCVHCEGWKRRKGHDEKSFEPFYIIFLEDVISC